MRAGAPDARSADRGRLADTAFLLPVLVLLAVFLFYPFVYGLVLSVHESRGTGLGAFVGLEHFTRALFGDAVFHRSLLNTLTFTAVAVVVQTGLGFLLAALIAPVRRGVLVLQVVFFAPFVLASVAVGEVWRFLYAPFVGIGASLASAIGADGATIAPLADPNTALWAILAAFIWRFAGFTVVVYLAAMRALPREYQEQAVLEGAGTLQRLRYVTWPLLWPQTFALVLLTTLGTLRIFDMVWVMTEGGPAHATETVATHVYSTAFRFLDLGYAQAMAIVLGILMLLLVAIEYRLLDRRAEQARG